MRANGMSRTQSSSKELVKEITALKSQLRKLSAAMEADANDGVKGTISAIETKSRAAIDDALEAAQAFIDEQTENAREMTDAALEKTAKMRDDVADSLIETVKARPLGTLAAVIGIGFLAGYLCRRP
jgi:DNA anti-recombination protein RmuC